MGMLARHLMRDGVEVVRGLLWSDAGPDRSDDKQAMVEALDEEAVALDLFLIDDGDPELRPEEEFRAVEACGGDSNDGERMPVQVDCCPNDVGIGVEPCAPKMIAQDDIGCGVGTALIALVEEAAEGGLNSKKIEVVA